MSTGVDPENLEMTKVTEKVGAISNHLKTKRPLKQDSIRKWRKGTQPQSVRSAHGYRNQVKLRLH